MFALDLNLGIRKTFPTYIAIGSLDSLTYIVVVVVVDVSKENLIKRGSKH